MFIGARNQRGTRLGNAIGMNHEHATLTRRTSLGRRRPHHHDDGDLAISSRDACILARDDHRGDRPDKLQGSTSSFRMGSTTLTRMALRRHACIVAVASAHSLVARYSAAVYWLGFVLLSGTGALASAAIVQASAAHSSLLIMGLVSTYLHAARRERRDEWNHRR